jgi:hypothetical protein
MGGDYRGGTLFAVSVSLRGGFGVSPRTDQPAASRSERERSEQGEESEPALLFRPREHVVRLLASQRRAFWRTGIPGDDLQSGIGPAIGGSRWGQAVSRESLAMGIICCGATDGHGATSEGGHGAAVPAAGRAGEFPPVWTWLERSTRRRPITGHVGPAHPDLRVQATPEFPDSRVSVPPRVQ